MSNVPQFIIVRAHAGAPESRVIVDGDRYHVYVTAPATGGRANVAIRELLAEHFNVPLVQVVISRGHTSPTKHITVYRSA